MAGNQSVNVPISAEDKTRQGIDSAIANLDRLKSAGDQLSGGFSGIGAGLVTSLLGVGFTATIKEAIDSLDKMDEAAERLGITTESLSALAYAGKLTGAEFEDMTSAIGKLSVKVGEAAAGNKEAAAWFSDVGVKIKDASGNVKSADVVLAEIADRFSDFADGAEKNNLAADGFGKSWQKILPLLNSGSKGLEELRTEADKLGGIIDGKLAKQAAEFNDNLDRLGTLSSAAGKSIASGLLPTLNEAAQSFLIAQKNMGGFWSSLTVKMPGLQAGVNVSDELKKARDELKGLENDRDRWLANGNRIEDAPKIEGLIDTARRRVEYYKELQRIQALSDSAENYGNEGRGKTNNAKEEIKRTKLDDGKLKEKKETAEATEEAKAYAKAMEGLAKASKDAGAAGMDLSATQKALYELMSSPTWAQMPETWRLAAVEQFEFAYASEQTAKEMERLNKLLGETESSKLEEARKDMQLLAKALEDGRISEEQFTEAVQARFKDGNEKIKEQKSLAEELGLTFQSSFEEAVAGGGKFSDVLKGLEQDIIKIITRMTITQPLMDSVKGVDWSGALSSLASSFSPSAAAKGAWFDGGVSAFAKGGAFTNSVVSNPTLFKFASGGKLGLMGEAGPEAIMPLKRGADGRLGVSADGMGGGSVTVNVINNANSTANVQRRTDDAGNSVIDVIIEQVKGSIASDISRGSGSVPGALQSTYGLNRTAGAY